MEGMGKRDEGLDRQPCVVKDGPDGRLPAANGYMSAVITERYIILTCGKMFALTFEAEGNSNGCCFGCEGGRRRKE